MDRNKLSESETFEAGGFLRFLFAVIAAREERDMLVIGGEVLDLLWRERTKHASFLCTQNDTCLFKKGMFGHKD